MTLLTAFWHGEQAVSQTRTVAAIAANRDWATPIAFDGGFVVSWEDARPGPHASAIYNVRLSPSGVVLDPQGLRWAAGELGGSDPSGRCLGTSCLIAWHVHGRGTSTRVFDTATGTASPALIHSAPTTEYQMPAVATDGARYLVLWDEGPIAGQLLRADGTPESPAQALVTSGNPELPSAAWPGATFLMTWVEGATRTVQAQLFSSSGTPQGAPLNMGGWSLAYFRGGPPVVASAGTTYLVAWVDGSDRLAVRRVSHGGVSMDSAPVFPFGTAPPRQFAALIPERDSLVLAWLQNGVIRAGRLRASDLSVLTPETPVLNAPSSTNFRASAAPAGAALLTWTQYFGAAPTELRAGLLALDAGLTGSIVDISTVGPDVHESPRAAWVDGGFVVGWGSRADGGGLPIVRLLDRAAAPAAPPTAIEPPDRNFVSLDLVRSGLGARAVWTSGLEVRTCGLDGAGQPGAVSSAANAATTWIHSTRLATLSGTVLLVWAEAELSGRFRIGGRRVDPDGGLMGTAPFTIHQQTRDQYGSVALAASSSQYGLAWVLGYQVFFVRLSSTGAVVGSPIGPLETDGADWVSVASDGSDFLVVWNSATLKAAAARVAASGVLIDTVPLPLGPGSVGGAGLASSRPEVAFDGTLYQVVWADAVTDGGGLEIVWRTVTTDGGMGPPTMVAGGLGVQSAPHIVAGSPGRLLTVWLDSDDQGDGVARVRARAFADLADGQACLANGECRSGVCAVVCCSPSDGGCGPPDGGTDAGADGGSNDGGGVDGGPVDGGSDDAGIGGPRAWRIGCDCRAIEGVGAWLWGIALWLSRRARRRGSCRLRRPPRAHGSPPDA